MKDFSQFLLPDAVGEDTSRSPGTDRFPKARSALPKPAKGEHFIAISMPWSWFAIAAGLPGKAVAVALVIWWLVTVRGTEVVTFSYKKARVTGLTDESIRKTIQHLERAGLIEVERSPGRSPRIRVLDVPYVPVDRDEEP